MINLKVMESLFISLLVGTVIIILLVTLFLASFVLVPVIIIGFLTQWIYKRRHEKCKGY